MDWQLLLTSVAIAVALGYVGWAARRAWQSSRGGCSGGCGCAKAKPEVKSEPALIAPEQLTMRQSSRQ